MTDQYRDSLLSCSPFSLCELQIPDTDVKSTTYQVLKSIVSGRNHHRIRHGNDQEYSIRNPWGVAWCGLTSLGGLGWVLQPENGSIHSR